MGAKAGAEKRTRTRKTEKYDSLCNIFMHNFLVLTGNASQSSLAGDLGISTSTISSWATGDRLPSVDQLVLLAEHYAVSPDWLITEHGIRPSVTTEMTYSEAFRTLRRFTDQDLIDLQGVSDYFLAYMVRRTDEIAKLAIPEDKKDAWYNRLIADFSVPIEAQLEMEYYFAWAERYGDIHEEDTYLAVLRAVQDYHKGINKEELQSVYMEWMEKHYPDRYWEMVQIPQTESDQ